MLYTIRNEAISVDIESKGAIPVSFVRRSDGFDFFGKGSSLKPVFPFCGRFYYDKYLYDGVFYAIPDYDFIGKSDFTLIEQSKDRILFGFGFTENTLNAYPFKFTLMISYTVEAEELLCSVKVINPGRRKLIYSLGMDLRISEKDDNAFEVSYPDSTVMKELGCNEEGYLSGKTGLAEIGNENLCPVLKKTTGIRHILSGKSKSIFINTENKGKLEIASPSFEFTSLLYKDGKFEIMPCTGLPSVNGKLDNIRSKSEMNVCDASKSHEYSFRISICK